MRFDHLSSHALAARLVELVATERRTVADFLLHLVELERRGLHLELGYSSTFAFLVDRLKLTKASAFRRTEAARLIARYPVIVDYLRDGRLSLTTLVELRKVLTDEDHLVILDRAAGKTEDEVKELVAALAPREAPPDLFRRLPRPALVATQPQPQPQPQPDLPATVVTAAPAQATAAPVVDTASSGPAPPISPNPCQPAARRVGPGTVEPISEDLRVLRVTVGRAFADDLAHVKALLSHSIPDGDLARVLHECIRRTIAACEKRRRGSDQPRPRKGANAEPPRGPEPPRGRNIPVAVRRVVWQRDGGACAFTAADGKRCGSTHQVQLHHLIPFARGGPATVENLTLRCKRHNLHAADTDYGREHMRRARARPIEPARAGSPCGGQPWRAT